MRIKPGRIIQNSPIRTISLLAGDESKILIKHKDLLLDENGSAKRIRNIGIWRTTTTCNVFHLLRSAGVDNHFCKKINKRVLIAQRVDVSPMKIAMTKVSPKKVSPKNSILEYPLLSYSLENGNNLPIEWNCNQGCFQTLNAKTPGYLENIEGIPNCPEEFQQVHNLARRTFQVIDSAWERQDILLTTLRIKYGCSQGRPVLTGFISLDSMGLGLPKGNSFIPLEKTPQIHAWVAARTAKF